MEKDIMNSVTLFIWGFIGFLIGVSFIFIQYRLHCKKHMQILTELETAEIELLKVLHRINEQQALTDTFNQEERVTDIIQSVYSQQNRQDNIVNKELDNKKNILRSLSLLLPIYGQIPAGSPAWVPDKPERFSEVTSITIDDKLYNFFSLRNELTINIRNFETIFLLKVNGDSMNLAAPVHIENDDYVLMSKRDAAESGDIVAVEIVREDQTATLKRYLYKEGKHLLVPESDNPNLPSHISMTKDFFIRGIALAVLKPIH
jgi:SOS-response transcriptional repressor LexA